MDFSMKRLANKGGEKEKGESKKRRMNVFCSHQLVRNSNGWKKRTQSHGWVRGNKFQAVDQRNARR
jgi:hypothetical protein